MKAIVSICFSFLFFMFITICSTHAQIDINKVKTKGKNVTKKATKPTNGSAATTVTKDQSYIDFINEKYQLIFQTKAGLNIIDVQRNGVHVPTHYEGAKKLDYPNVLQTINSKKSDGGADSYNIQKLLAYGQEYEDLYNSYLKNTINKYIEEAYKHRMSDLPQAATNIKYAYELAQAVTLILPDNEDAVSLLGETKKAFEDIYPSYEDIIYTSEFHKNNTGKIFFSKTPIVVGKEDPSQFTTKFSATDNIYAIAYLDGTIKQLGGWNDVSGEYNISITGNNHRIRFGHNEEDYEKSYYIIEIIPHPHVAVHGLDAVEFAKILAPLSPRQHTLTLSFGSQTNKGLAVSDEIQLDWSNVNSEAISANAEKASANARENYAKNTKLPDFFSTPSKKFNDPQITNVKINELFQKFDKECVQVLKVWIGDLDRSEEWHTFTHSTGVPDFKRTNRYIAIVFKAKNGNCYFTWDNMAIARNYEGGGKWGELIMTSVKYSKTRIACENVK
jgi:hypothetical protein